jgi:EamA domain-containing membrane protein RarD
MMSRWFAGGARGDGLGLRRPIMLALVAAFVIEALNLKFVSFPIDVGFPDDAPLYAKLLAGQWVCLHYLGFVILRPFDGAAFQRLFYPVLFVSGYVETALLLIVGVLIFHRYPPRP